MLFLASRTNCSVACSPYRTLPPGWYRVLRDPTIFYQCFISCIGFRSGSALLKIATATLVHRSLSGHAPGYLADDCQLVTDARVRLLHSADTRTLIVHRISSCFGDSTFAAAATRVWNSLLSDLRKAELSYIQHTFRRSLNTFLFRQSDHGALWTFLNCAV